MHILLLIHEPQPLIWVTVSLKFEFAFKANIPKHAKRRFVGQSVNYAVPSSLSFLFAGGVRTKKKIIHELSKQPLHLQKI